MEKKEIEKTEDKSVAVLDENYFKENFTVGMEEVTQEDIPTPTLSLIQNNSTLTGEDGKPLPRGKYYYKGSGEVYDVVECSLLALTKKDMPSFSDKEKKERVHIYLGVLYPTLEPFLIFFRGWGLSTSRAFQGQRTKFKRPAYCLKLKLESEQMTNDKGTFFIPKIQIVEEITDPTQIVILEDLAKTYAADFKEKTDTILAAKDLPF